MKRAIAVIAFCAAVPLCAEEPCATVPTVSVSGSSSVRVKPDRVSFAVGVETDAPAVAAAFQKNSRTLNAVIAALKAKGVQPGEIQTSNFMLSSRDEQGRKLSGYRVSNTVTVTREQTEKIGELLQAAIEAGATDAGSIRFFVADPKKLQADGIDAAFKDARSKAEKLAQLSGRTLGQVISVTDQSFGGGYYPPAVLKPVAEAITVTAEAPAIETGVQDLTFSVAVVFALQ